MPFRDLATTDRSVSASDSSVLEAAITWYQKAAAWKKFIAASGLFIQIHPTNQNAADAGRLQLSIGLEKLERFSDAAYVLEEIHDPGMKDAKTRIPDLWKRDREQRAAAFAEQKR